MARGKSPKRKSPKQSKDEERYRVFWVCPKCGGEGSDIEEFGTYEQAKQWAQEMKKEGMSVDMETLVDGEWKDVE